MAETSFDGFPPETFEFLEGVAANNEKSWFEANRGLYEAGYLNPSFAFIEAVGPELQKVSPDVQYAAKVNGSLIRINRDVRFSKDKRPYKDHLDLMFWHGEKRGWNQPTFFLRLTTEQVFLGAGMHAMPKDHLQKFRDAVVDDKAGPALEKVIAGVKASGPYRMGEATRKQVPRGYDKDHRRAGLLLLDGLWAMADLPAKAARRPDFADECLRHFRNCWPLAKWMLEELTA